MRPVVRLEGRFGSTEGKLRCGHRLGARPPGQYHRLWPPAETRPWRKTMIPLPASVIDGWNRGYKGWPGPEAAAAWWPGVTVTAMGDGEPAVQPISTPLTENGKLAAPATPYAPAEGIRGAGPLTELDKNCPAALRPVSAPGSKSVGTGQSSQTIAAGRCHRGRHRRAGLEGIAEARDSQGPDWDGNRLPVDRVSVNVAPASMLRCCSR